MQRRPGICMHSRKPHTVLTASAALMFLVAATQLLNAQTFSVLYSFKGTTDGSNPQAGLYLNGVYGTTLLGGNPTCACGTVFKFSSGTLTTLHSFAGPDGANPTAGLVADASGNLYGTTSQGGAGSSAAGTVFKLTAPATGTGGGTWAETVLHTFTGGTDGAHPLAGLVQDNAGNLYGTTNAGGALNFGTVFKIDTSGSETILYSFQGSPDGAYPYAGLILDSAGNLYGTTNGGGASNSGTVFELATTGKETVLHSFNGTTDGAYPSSALITDSSGNFYGTANQGGSYQEGTIFKLATGNFTVLHTFKGRTAGANPAAGMVLSPNGNLYGATTEGGNSDDDGTLFELNPTTNTYTLIHTFASGHFGNYPYTGLVLDSSGNLYGATESGGTSERGLVYEVAISANARSEGSTRESTGTR